MQEAVAAANEAVPRENLSADINRFKVLDYVEYALIRAVGAFFNLLPLSLVLSLARPVGTLLFLILKRSRETALKNLREAYGHQKSEAEIQLIARQSFIQLCEFAVEWFRMPQLVQDPERYLAIHHAQLIQSALEKKSGALLLVTHTGNWEIMALIGGLLVAKRFNATMYALARSLKNPYLYDYSLRLRGLTGLKSIDKVGGVREVVKRLKQNGIVCLLADQRISEGGVDVDFFERPALTTSLPAVAALRLGTPVLFAFVHRTSDLHYVVEMEGPVPVEKTGDLKQDIRTNTQRFNDRIEAEIRKDPSKWLWMHNRWRTQEGAKK